MVKDDQRIAENRSGPPNVRCAVLIPCFDEELTVGTVIADFREQLPHARIYVFDNNSRDRTTEVAERAGAIVIPEKRQGKGYVIMSMLEKVDADIYVLVDGDATYPADCVHRLIEPLLNQQADHTVGTRQAIDPGKAYRSLHPLGNRLLTFLVNRIFGTSLVDVMSGYRAFTREVAETVPLIAGGFDVETEFTLQTLEKGFVISEVPVPYRERPAGSYSKLSTFRDGFRVLGRTFTILKDFRPFLSFGCLAIVLAMLSLLCGYPAVIDYVRERYVYHVPLAVLAGVLGAVAIGLLQTGIVLQTMNARIKEIHALRRRNRGKRREE